MKNAINQTMYMKAGLFFAVALFAGVLFSAPHAVSAYSDGGDYDGGCCDSSYVSSVDYSYPSYDYSPSYVSSVDYSYPSYDYSPSYVSSVDYSYPSYDYSTPSYVSSIDYSYPSYSYTPSYSTPSYGLGGGLIYVQQQQQQSSVNVNNNTNNVNVNIPTYTPPQQYCPAGYTGVYPNCAAPVQYCPAGYSGTYPNCYQPPVYQNPSCSLSASQTYVQYGQP